MCRGPEETFLQRRHTDGQQMHGKMFNITNHQGNANRNHNDISPHTCQYGCYEKQKTSVGQDVEKRELPCTVVGNVNWCSHYRK